MENKATEEFKQRVYELVSDEYSVIGTYKNTRTKIKMKHNVCGNEYETFPHNFLNGRRCPYCRTSEKLNTKTFKEKLFRVRGNEYDLIDEYKSSVTPVTFRHNNLACGCHRFEKKPELVIRLTETVCPICKPLNIVRTIDNEIFQKRLNERFGNEYTLVSDYQGITKPVMIRHNCEACNYSVFSMRKAQYMYYDRYIKCRTCDQIRKGKLDPYYKGIENFKFQK